MSVVKSISQIAGLSNKKAVAGAFLAEVNADGSVAPDTVRQFQYYPESISDNRSVPLEDQSAVGSSHPIYQWTRGSGREISFSAIFTSEDDSIPQTGLLAGLTKLSSALKNPAAAAVAAAKNIAGAVKSDPYTVDVAAAIMWLRSMTYPSYAPTGISYAPPALFLYLEGSGIVSYIGSFKTDVVPVLMTSCNIEYESFFESGKMRTATVNLSFVETIQVGTNWGYVGRSNFNYSTRYTLGQGKTFGGSAPETKSLGGALAKVGLNAIKRKV